MMIAANVGAPAVVLVVVLVIGVIYLVGIVLGKGIKRGSED